MTIYSRGEPSIENVNLDLDADAENQDPDSSAKKPKIPVPAGFDSHEDFLADMRAKWTADVSADQDNITASVEDGQFLVGDQWPANIRQRREKANKPVMTVNRLIAFIAAIVGARRLNETTIKVQPDMGGKKDVAALREDLIRSIQKTSNAEFAYDKALECQVIGGIGNFQVCLDYAMDDVFYQDIKVEAIPDSTSVVWDRMLIEPTGSDAGHCFVTDSMPRSEFEARWPWATAESVATDDNYAADNWVDGDDVRVVSYWRMRARRRKLILTVDNKVEDVTDKPSEMWLARVQTRPDGSPIMRDAPVRYAQMYLCSGLNILEPAYELPISRLPVFRVPGWEVSVARTKHRWGLIRFLKDPQRLHNFWRSTIAEKLMMSPKAKWLASDIAVAGLQQAYRDAHKSDDPLLVYKGESGAPPQLIQPAQLEAAMINEAQTSSQDLKDVSNIHEASLGQPSNEVSGKAILARQRVGEAGTVIYHDNLIKAQEQAGLVINQLIPICYDTARTIVVLGDDDKARMQVINDETNPESIDITIGKYKIAIATGPNYNTKRVEAVESMMALVNAAPQVFAGCMDLVVENMDWPGADKIAKRLRALNPAAQADTPADEITPEQAAAQQAAQKEQAEQMALDKAGKLAQVHLTDAETQEAVARGALAQAQAVKSAARAELARAQAAKVPIDAHNAVVKTESEARSAALGDRLSVIDMAHPEPKPAPKGEPK